MNCREFESLWNERLDERGADPGELAGSLREHAAACPSCRAVDARYRALFLAIRALEPLPAPPAAFSRRVLAALASDEPAPVAFGFPAGLTMLATAAALVLAVGLGLRFKVAGNPGPNAAPAPSVAAVREIDPKDLSEALAAASSATWDLAREASAPAARVGRQILSQGEPGEPAAVLPLPEPLGRPADVWQSVGDRLNAGVRPLGGTARHAFGFLLGVAPEDDRTPPRPAEGA